jgi:hypothetical protein
MPSETVRHQALKSAALNWAWNRGYRSAATEVRAPKSPYRVDVAALAYTRTTPGIIVAVFECKQSRADWLRNCRCRAELAERLNAAQTRKSTLERLLRVHFPQLGTGDSLFPEWETFDFSGLQHRGYRRVLRDLELSTRQLAENTKFERMTHYQVGHLHYIVAPSGLVEKTELPSSWGLLEQATEGKDSMLVEAVSARFFQSRNAATWLRRITRVRADDLFADR